MSLTNATQRLGDDSANAFLAGMESSSISTASSLAALRSRGPASLKGFSRLAQELLNVADSPPRRQCTFVPIPTNPAKTAPAVQATIVVCSRVRGRRGPAWVVAATVY